jgi:serine/threonine-protein kinase RsbW
MPEIHEQKAGARLTLKSRLQDLALVWPWVEALALEYSIPDNTQFAINLCLEEALSNVIRHGYAGQPDYTITIDCTPAEEGWLTFIVEDSAPPFAPCEFADSDAAAVPASIEDAKPGGNGIALMRRFAGTLRWERLPTGNRLTLGFQIASHAPLAT